MSKSLSLQMAGRVPCYHGHKAESDQALLSGVRVKVPYVRYGLTSVALAELLDVLAIDRKNFITGCLLRIAEAYEPSEAGPYGRRRLWTARLVRIQPTLISTNPDVVLDHVVLRAELAPTNPPILRATPEDERCPWCWMAMPPFVESEPCPLCGVGEFHSDHKRECANCRGTYYREPKAEGLWSLTRHRRGLV